MNLRQLRTIVAIADHGSFAAAGQAIGLSQSAVSLQIKSLEEEIGVALFDRTLRPPRLTPAGQNIVDRARTILGQIDEIKGATDENRIAGRLTVGAVPTTLSGIVPLALGELRDRQPGLAITVVSGSSSALADQALRGEIDVAVVAKPPQTLPGLDWRTVADEPYAVIGPESAVGQTDRELLTGNPFIWFNRKTWAGQQIEQHLIQKKIRVEASMEIDSLDAIRSMVSAGLGVSIIPMCIGAAPLPANVRTVPLGNPANHRMIGLLHRRSSPNQRLIDTFHEALERLAGQLSTT